MFQPWNGSRIEHVKEVVEDTLENKKESPKVPKFFTEVCRLSIVNDELVNPFDRLKLYTFIGVDSHPLDTSEIPEEAYPYPDCIFVSVGQALILASTIVAEGKGSGWASTCLGKYYRS